MENFIAPISVALAGLVGGIANALMSGTQDVQLPSTAGGKGGTIWRPGWISSLALGAIAATVSWALYGTAAGTSIFEKQVLAVTWANLAAAVLIGVGGSRWLSAEVDKNVFHRTAVEAARSEKNPELAATISTASPGEALKAAISAP